MLAEKKSSGSSAGKTAEHKANPVKGKVDFAALRRSLKARFPKTIAYLAK